MATSAIIAGVFLTGWAWRQGGWLLVALPFGLMTTISGLRTNDLNAFHEAAHGTFCRTQWINDMVGELIGAIRVSQNFLSYTPEHSRDHHSAKFTTLGDPTFAFLVKGMGLRPGMTLRQAWTQTLKCLLSPRFHARMTASRLKSYVVGASWLHWVLATAYLTALVWAVATWGWATVFVAWGLPLSIGINQVITIRSLVEHVFPPADTHGRRRREVLAGCTHDVFCGSAAPPTDLPTARYLAALTWWGTKTVCYHLPARLLIVPGEASTHSYHHRHPKLCDWYNYIFNRQQDVVDGHPGWESDYTEVWGLIRAINETFRTLQYADPVEFTP